MKILDARDYKQTSWKNGNGVTTDLFVHPPGATHENFEIRIARSPIAAEGAFSSFPGIDRRIVLIEGQRLDLDFGDRTVNLAPYRPVAFDSVLTPCSRLPDGPVEVVNVMTRRGLWTSNLEVFSGERTKLLTGEADDVLFIYVLRASLRASTCGRSVTLGPGNGLLLSGPAAVKIELEREFAAICARLSWQDHE